MQKSCVFSETVRADTEQNCIVFAYVEVTVFFDAFKKIFGIFLVHMIQFIAFQTLHVEMTAALFIFSILVKRTLAVFLCKSVYTSVDGKLGEQSVYRAFSDPALDTVKDFRGGHCFVPVFLKKIGKHRLLCGTVFHFLT